MLINDDSRHPKISGSSNVSHIIINSSNMLNTKTRKLVFGIFLLLLVDVIWVSSSELTKVFICCFFFHLHIINKCIFAFAPQFLYENEQFDKPFFCTYFKTSMFILYLVVMGVISPWKEYCNKNTSYTVCLFLIFFFVYCQMRSMI